MSYYDRQGNPIDMLTWANSYEFDQNKRVAETTVGKLWVSTVWLGLDHSLWGGPPMIFETMVFVADGVDIEWDEDYQERYSTEEQAKAGHEVAVAWAREHQPADPYAADHQETPGV